MPLGNVAASASGNNTVISAPGSSRFIRVFGYNLTAAAAVTCYWNSTGGVQLSGNLYATNNAGGGIATGFYRDGIFDVPPGEGLRLNLSAGVAVGGEVRYEVLGPHV